MARLVEAGGERPSVHRSSQEADIWLNPSPSGPAALVQMNCHQARGNPPPGEPPGMTSRPQPRPATRRPRRSATLIMRSPLLDERIQTFGGISGRHRDVLTACFVFQCFGDGSAHGVIQHPFGQREGDGRTGSQSSRPFVDRAVSASVGTTRFTRPISRACLAETLSPSSASSLAL